MNCHCLLSTYMYTSKKSQAYYSVGIRTLDLCNARAVGKTQNLYSLFSMQLEQPVNSWPVL